MIDPVGAFQEVRENFLLYLRTAFGTQFPSMEKERERLMRMPGAIHQEPWIEPLPQFMSSGKKIGALAREDAPGLAIEDKRDLAEFASRGLLGDFELYTHQLEMLNRALAGQNAVVTAGTGSGKTEAFLLPLFAYLLRESRNWTAPNPEHPHLNDWWRNQAWLDSCNPVVGNAHRLQRSYRVPQRSHETRPAGVRALVLFPMNALVEDQLTRLRRALDSEQAREWLAQSRGGNRIYFGRYTGSTPVPGHEVNQHGNPNKTKIEELLREMAKADRAFRAAAQYAHDQQDREVLNFFPQLDGAEMRSRWDMQDSPPDILITNYSMLSIMLMREEDENVFARTQEWLRQDGSVFHLIVDELHLYRGTSGTEVAYLLRLLLSRLGISPDSPKLRILAASASLDPTDAASIRFLSEFFGTRWTAEQIIPGTQASVSSPVPMDELPVAPFTALAVAAQRKDPSALTAACHLLTTSLGFPSDPANELPSLRRALESSSLGHRMLAACQGPQGTRAVALSHFAKALFGERSSASLTEGVRGLLVARGLCGVNTERSSLPAFRFHWFFRNIEGLWACTMPGCQCEQEVPDDGRPAGRLFVGSAPILCGNPNAEHRVLELLYCEQCGTVLFGGSRLTLPDNRGWELLPTEPDIEGIPDKQAARFVERRSYRAFGIFWPDGAAGLNPDATGPWNHAAGTNIPQRNAQARWSRASLDVRSGLVVLGEQDPVAPDGHWLRGHLFHLPNPPSEEDLERLSALPSVCPNCAADYSRRVYRRSPIRGFRTGFSKVSQLLSKELFYQLPETDRRKLVVFSDSREDAAGIANGIERLHYADLVRQITFDELRSLAIDEPALLSDLENTGAAEGSESRRFAKRNPAQTELLLRLIRLAARPLPDDLEAEDLEPIRERRDRAQAVIDSIRERGTTRVVPLRVLFEGSENPQEPGELIQRLKGLGVNPAGQDVLYQEFYYDDAFQHWTKLFDFTSIEGGWKNDLSPGALNRRDNMLRAKVTSEICDVLFSRLYFGFEAAGLGLACIRLAPERLVELADQSGLPTDHFENVCNSCLRILGELYRYPQVPQTYPLNAWPDWNDARAKLRNYVRACATKGGGGENQLRASIFEAICINSQHQNFTINPRYLWVRIALPRDPVWTCRACRRPHLHSSGGVCTNCLADLTEAPDQTCTDLHKRNYYAREAVDGRPPLRLHSEELSAQTDDQAERQRHFRNVVVNLGDEQRELHSQRRHHRHPERDHDDGGRGRHRGSPCRVPREHAADAIQLPATRRQSGPPRPSLLCCSHSLPRQKSRRVLLPIS